MENNLSGTEPQTKENQKKKKSRNCFKRAWRAVKGAFSRPGKTKVVPFDTDPSDLEEDPYVQTHLRVFERVDIQDLDDPADPQSTAPEEPTDSQPGSSNLEQTSFQDPDVLQQGASGLEPSSPQHQAESTSGPSVLEPSAPEKPADHRPEPQTKENQKKKKSRTCFKRVWRAVKGAFSRPGKTKVVPFDTDPSDLEEDPYVQTHLRVFERVDIQDLDDPADPQSTAPEEPTDSQPGSSTASKVLNRWIFLPSCSEEFTALYEVEYFIESGHRGKVYGGFRRSDGLKVAIKTISTQYDPVERVIIPGHSKPLPKEVAINLQLLESGKCPHIMEMLDWFEEKHQLIIVMELPEPCINLRHFVHDHPTDETLARHFMRQAIIGAKYCLDHGVNHVSLRVDNIVVNTETLQIKLIDFERNQIIRSSGETDMNYCDRAYADADTVYKFGYVLFYIMRCNERGTAGLSEACRDLMKVKRWPFEQVDMPTLDEFMDHEWFKQG